MEEEKKLEEIEQLVAISLLMKIYISSGHWKKMKIPSTKKRGTFYKEYFNKTVSRDKR